MRPKAQGENTPEAQPEHAQKTRDPLYWEPEEAMPAAAELSPELSQKTAHRPASLGPAEPGEGLARARELCRCAAAFSARGWCQATSGNFSLCLSRDPLRLLITPSGLDKGALAPEQLLVVGPDGAVVDGGAAERGATPSAETLLHCAVVETARAGAVLHTHSVAATLLGEHFLPRGRLTLSGYEMQKGITGVGSHRAAVEGPVLANSQDVPTLAVELRRLLAGRPELCGLLLAGHGLYAWGASLAEARRHVEAFEFLFECVARRTPFASYPVDPTPGGP
jgi:methylthioribulose-1-phosphate dehydratase